MPIKITFTHGDIDYFFPIPIRGSILLIAYWLHIACLCVFGEHRQFLIHDSFFLELGSQDDSRLVTTEP